MLPPHNIDPLLSIAKDRIAAALATRYNVRKSVAKAHIPHHIERWGKVRRIEGGDTMTAAHLGHAGLDRRDATHIRVSCGLALNCMN